MGIEWTKRMGSSGVRVVLGAALFLAAATAAPQEEAELDELDSLSIEELLDVEVTSVSKRPQQRTASAAAIHVITQEEIRRSPARSIPELLRTVPGLHVARFNRNSWSVSSRGFSGQFSNKLLVLIDGRSVYTPLFSGVYWQDQMSMLEDIDRIEIIRGPGGSLWGANAVNGVINIITKDARDTEGGLLRIGGGTEKEVSTAIRYGDKLGEDFFYRLYAEYEQWDEGLKPDGSPASDDWSRRHTGFRADWRLDERDHLTLQADAFRTDTISTLDIPFRYPPRERAIEANIDFTGFNVLARWRRTFSEDADLSVQLYVDEYHTTAPTVDDLTRTYDVNLQHTFRPHDRHHVVWGAGFRYTDHRLTSKLLIDFEPERFTDPVFSGFVQDTITVSPDIKLTVGSKFEHNDYSGFEVQPSARLVWTPSEGTAVWGAVSRAVRTPSPSEHETSVFALSAPFFRAMFFGSEDFDSEEVVAYEGGVRHTFSDSIAVDLAFFYNQYDSLATSELRAPYLSLRPPVAIVLPSELDNNMEATTYGAEAALDWFVSERWHLRASYSYLEVDADLNPQTVDFISDMIESNSPEQQFTLESLWDLSQEWELNTTLRYVDRLPAFGVDDYLTVDARLAWKPRENLEFALIGRNLLDSERLEFAPTFINTQPTQTERGIFAELTWTF